MSYETNTVSSSNLTSFKCLTNYSELLVIIIMLIVIVIIIVVVVVVVVVNNYMAPTP